MEKIKPWNVYRHSSMEPIHVMPFRVEGNNVWYYDLNIITDTISKTIDEFNNDFSYHVNINDIHDFIDILYDGRDFKPAYANNAEDGRVLERIAYYTGIDEHTRLRCDQEARRMIQKHFKLPSTFDAMDATDKFLEGTISLNELSIRRIAFPDLQTEIDLLYDDNSEYRQQHNDICKKHYQKHVSMIIENIISNNIQNGKD